MKILLYCMPRSRSSYLAQAVSNYYNYANLFEPYHKPITGPIDNKISSWKYEEKWKIYVNESNKLTESLKTKDNYVIKVFADALYNAYKFTDGTVPVFNYKDIKKTDVLPLIDHYNIKDYDIIFATMRKNKVDWVCSYLTAMRLNTFLFTSKQKAKFYAPKNIKLKYSKKLIEQLAFVNLLYNLNLKVLENFNPNIIKLEYNEISSYVKENYPGVTTALIDAEYNYKDCIANYSEIAEDFEQARIDIEEEKLIKLLSE